MNKDINEWILDEGVEPLHELYNKKGKIIFLTDFLEKHLKEQLTLTDVVASLPDANKLYKMAETIVSKQVLIYNMPENRQIDWEDLKNDWFDWLDEEIKG